MSAIENTEAESAGDAPALSRDQQIKQLQRAIKNAEKWSTGHHRAARDMRINGRYEQANWQEQQAEIWERKQRGYEQQLADLLAVAPGAGDGNSTREDGPHSAETDLE